MSYFSEVKLVDKTTGTAAVVNASGQLKVVLDGKVDDNNSSATPLLAAGVFTGTASETLDYGIIFVSVYSDVASATDGLAVEQSCDGTNWDHIDNYTIPAATGKTFSFQPACKYFRIVYTNGGSDQTAFRLSTIFKKTNSKPSSHRLKDSIIDDDDGELVIATIKGRNPQRNYVDFESTRTGNFKVAVQEYGDTSSIDAFSRLRVSNPYTIFDSKQLHDDAPLFWDESLGGSATSAHSATDARTRLSVTASASDFAIRQTKMKFNYQPAKAQLIFMTFYSPQEAGITKRVGLFDGTSTNNMTPNNGIFLQTDGDISWNIAKNGTTTETVAQANWNVDTLDGSGDANNPSGLTYVPGACQIAVLDYEWLGVGRVRVGFVINGQIIYVHKFNHANDVSFTSVYMSSPNLPLRYDIQSDGSATGTLDHICSSVISEGGREDNGSIRYASTEGTEVTCTTENTTYAILGIRLKSAYHDVSVKLLNIALQIQTASDMIEWSIILNPTVAGTFTYADETDSAVQIARGATANTVTGGYKLAGGYVESGTVPSGASGSGGRGLENAILLGSTIGGTMDTLVLCATPRGGTSGVAVEGGLNWRELL